MARHLYSFSLDSDTVYIASAISTQPGSVERSSIGQLQEISSTADFYPRYVLMERLISSYYQYSIVLQVYSVGICPWPGISQSSG